MWKRISVGAALVGLTGVGVASAAIPSADGTIDGCYGQLTGILRIVDETETCRPSEHQLTWNQVGPQGDIGPPGLPGPQGEAGPPGSSATTAVYFDGFYSDGLPTLRLSGGTGTTEVLRLDPLPAGSYVVEVRLELSLGIAGGGPGNSYTRCDLEGLDVPPAGATVELLRTAEPFSQPDGHEQIEFTTALDHAGGKLLVECTNISYLGFDDYTYITAASILATPVGAINPPS